MPPTSGLAMIVRAAVLFDDANSVLGLSARLTSENAHYRLEVTTANASIVRVNPTRIVLATARQNGEKTPSRRCFPSWLPLAALVKCMPVCGLLSLRRTNWLHQVLAR